MSAAAILSDLRARGVSVELDSDRLRVRGPRDTVATVRDLLRTHRAAIIEALRPSPEPDAVRAQVFEAGRRRGFPALPLWPGVTLAAGEDAWGRFASCRALGHDALLDRALAALTEEAC